MKDITLSLLILELKIKKNLLQLVILPTEISANNENKLKFLAIEEQIKQIMISILIEKNKYYIQSIVLELKHRE